MGSPVETADAVRHVAIAGNPNCGKTTLFNALTGMRQKTGNYPGVTVERVRASTGWAVRFADDLGTTAPPTERELAVLRDLQARTARAHGTAAA